MVSEQYFLLNLFIVENVVVVEAASVIQSSIHNQPVFAPEIEALLSWELENSGWKLESVNWGKLYHVESAMPRGVGLCDNNHRRPLFEKYM